MGSTFLVSGKVTLDALEAAKGARQVGTEMEKMAGSGIAGFEKAQQKVLDLTKNVASLRTELLHTNDPAIQAKLNAALQSSQKELRAAKTEMRGMTLESREASEKAQLLAGSFGVQIPQGLARMISRMEGAQAVLEATFKVGLVAAFAAGIVELGIRGKKAIDDLTDSTGAFKDIIEAAAAANNKLLASFSTVQAGARAIAETNQRVLQSQNQVNAAIERPLRPGVLSVLGPYGMAVDIGIQLRQRVKDIATAADQETKAFELLNEQLRRQNELAKKAADLSELRAAQHVAFTSGLEPVGKAQAELEFLKRADKEILADTAKTADERERQHELMTLRMAAAEDVLAKTIEDKERELTRKHAAEVNKRAEQFEQASNRMNAATLKNLQVTLDALKREEEMRQAGLDVEAAVRKAGWEEAKKVGAEMVHQTEVGFEIQREAAERAKAQFEKVAGSIESFIDRVVLQARSLADVFHQFLMQLLGSFVKWVSRMIAQALMGMRSAQGLGAGGSGLGGILGAVLGIGGGTPAFAGVTGGAGTTAFSAGSMGTLATLPLAGLSQSTIAAGMPTVIGAGGNVVMGGGIPTTAGGAVAGLAGLAPLLAAGGILAGGSLLGTAGSRGGPITGALGGALLGVGAAGTMMALGGSSMLGITGAALLTTPYGWIALAAIAGIGALVGALGRGKAKRKAAETEQTYEFAANALYDQYKKWTIDYDTALGGMQSLIQQGVQAEYSLGTKWGRKGAENLTMVIQAEIRALDDLRKQREQSTAAMAGMVLPEFAIGGPVPAFAGTTGGRGMLAVLHPGEFVMQRSAVDALGTSFLGALNRAPRFDGGGAVDSRLRGNDGRAGRGDVHIGTVNVYPEKGMSRMAAKNMVIQAVRDATMDGAL